MKKGDFAKKRSAGDGSAVALTRGQMPLVNSIKEAKYKAALLSAALCFVSARFCYARNRRMQPASPKSPVPTRPKLAGSGTGAGGSAASAANFEKEAS